jgi:hypothetical protein
VLVIALNSVSGVTEVKILITTKNGELLYQYDSLPDSVIHDNALVTGLISAIIALSSEVVCSFPREIEYEGKILYFYYENDLVASILADIESPFNGNILPLLVAEFKSVQIKHNFHAFEALRYENEIGERIKSCLAEYLSNIQRNMITIFEKTDLTDYDSLIKLKNVAKDGALEGNMDFLSFEVIGRLLPEGLDKILYGLVIGIPVVVVGNRNVVETMAQSLRFLSPTKLLKVKLWSHKYEKGFDILGTNDFRGLIPSHSLIIANLDDGIVYGGLSSQYFQDIATQLPGLTALEAYSLVRSELDWIFKALEALSIRAHSKDSLPLEKQMILLKLLEKLHG